MSETNGGSSACFDEMKQEHTNKNVALHENETNPTAEYPDAPGVPQDIACSLDRLLFALGLDDSLGHPLGQVGDLESH